ncbi:MAG: hypothetical protein QXM38_03015 [Candidatus Aenigmatarchaeota archaeon]
MKNNIVLLMFIFLLPVASSEVLLNHVGFGDTPSQVIINIYNNNSHDLENPSIFVNDKFYTQLQMRIHPRSSVNYILFLKPGSHEIELRYDNGSTKITINNNISLPIEEKRKEKTYVKTLSFAFIALIVLIIAILLIKKPKIIY